MKSWARELALGLLLTAAIPSPAVFAAQSAEQILIDKANYWRLKDRPDLAVEALQQLLSINPNQPDALYQYGIIDVQQGKIDDARNYLARLQKAAPGSPRIADLENAIRAGQVSPNELSEARRLAQRGQFAQSVEKYQQSFKGAPPPTFGVEYYMTLAGTPQGWPEARRGLEQLVQNSPNDAKAKLALAEVLTYHAETRTRGIRSLEQLSGDPVVGQQAVQSWKKALMWLGVGPEDRRLYNEYLAKYPQDAEIRQHVAEAEKRGGPTGGPGGPAAVGFVDLNRGNLAAAERQFDAELRRNPNDPGALSGLGIIRLRQRRLPQARELLGHAVTEYRRALASDPRDQAVQAGLRGALAALRSAETAGTGPRAGGPGPAAPPINPARARADALRTEGQALEAQGDLAGAAARYQEAIAVDATDPWARLDYARYLARRGDMTQGFAIVDPSASGATAESFYAAALFYNEMGRPADALALLDRIPAASRNADITAFHERILIAAETERARQMARAGNRGGARNVLMALYARPPQTAEKTRLIADALADIGATQEALQLARPNPAAANKKAVLDYAGLLFKSGRDAEAVAYLAQAESSGRINAAERQELEHLKVDIAARRADTLRTRGDIAGAYDQISSLLAAYPNDPTLLMAAGRIYASAGQNTIAMRFFDAAFRQAPTDLGVIRGAVGGAIQAGDLERARAYLAYGMQVHPNNPRLYYLDAEIARAGGDNGRAMYSLQVARGLDVQQAGTFEPLPGEGSVIVPGAAGPGGLPPNPFRRVSDSGEKRLIRLAAATAVTATDGSSAPTAAEIVTQTAGPLPEAAVSADSDDLIVPPRAGERPPRQLSLPALPAERPPVSNELAALSPAAGGDALAGSGDPVESPSPAATTRRHIAQLPPLPPPPVQTYTPPSYAAPQYPQPVAYAPQAVAYPQYAQQPVVPLQPLPPPPVQGYQPPLPYGTAAAPVPQDSLELDIQRSMAAIAAESGPIVQGGFGFRGRSGEDGLSRLDEITAPIEGIFSPFYTGTVRLQAIPTYLTAGTASQSSLLRFGHEPLLALTPGATLASLIPAGSQTAGGVSLNAAWAYSMFDGEIGTTPLGFPVTNLVGRLALTWPPPAAYTTALPTIPLAPTNVSQPLHVTAEAVRKPITESLLSFAGTKDPVTGRTWGGIVKSGGDALVSYDDGLIGVYGGAGFWSIDGKSVASNSEFEALVGAYVRPYRVGSNAFKVGVNLSYMGYDKNLRFFTFGQGGYFSPQTYLNFSVPMEYSGRTGRFTYLVGGGLGVQTFNEKRSPVFPNEPANQSALQAAFGSGAFYGSRNVTGLAFNARGQVEYQLDNGFSVGGLAAIDNAQNYTEGLAKLYLRKSFAPVTPSTALMPYSLPGSL